MNEHRLRCETIVSENQFGSMPGQSTMGAVRPLTSKSIWALGHGSIVWPRGLTSVPLGILAQAHNNYEPKLGVVQIPEKWTVDSSLRIAWKVILGRYANVRSHHPVSAW